MNVGIFYGVPFAFFGKSKRQAIRYIFLKRHCEASDKKLSSDIVDNRI